MGFRCCPINFPYLKCPNPFQEKGLPEMYLFYSCYPSILHWNISDSEIFHKKSHRNLSFLLSSWPVIIITLTHLAAITWLVHYAPSIFTDFLPLTPIQTCKLRQTKAELIKRALLDRPSSSNPPYLNNRPKNQFLNLDTEVLHGKQTWTAF